MEEKKMKSIIITPNYRDTVRSFVEWFTGEFNTDDRESQLVIKRLNEKLNHSEKTTEHSADSFVINELEIWFLRNYLQSAWQDNTCIIDKADLHELYDYIVEKDNEQTNK